MCIFIAGVTELLCITFSICDRWDLLAVIWVLLCDCAAGTRGIIQQVVRNDLSGQQMEYQFRLCGCSLRIPAGVLNLLGFSIVHTADSVDGALCGGTQARYFELLAASNQWAVAVGKLLGVLTFFTDGAVTDKRLLSTVHQFSQLPLLGIWD